MNYDPAPNREASEAVIDPKVIAHVIRRRAGLLVGVLALGLGVAAVYLHAQQPTYVSVAKLLIESQHGLGDVTYSGGGDAVDSAQVESQVEILRASIIADAVVRKLNLVADPEFVPPRNARSLLQALMAKIQIEAARIPLLQDLLAPNADPAASQEPARTAEEIFNTAVASFSERISVRRLGQSTVVEIDFAANSPEKAQRIASETVDVYLGGAWRAATSPNAFRRFNDDVLHKSLAVSNARVISAPLPPLGKSSPRTTLIFAFAAVASLFFGVSLALWLEGRRVARGRKAIADADNEVEIGSLSGQARMKRRYSLTDAQP